MTDEEVANICKITCRPGGTNNNNKNPNPGISASMKAENNLKLMCYYFHYKQRTSHALAVNQVNIANIHKNIALATNEKDHKDPEAPDIKITGNWTRIIEIIEDHLINSLGTMKIPRAYIIRDKVDVTPEANDSGTNYPTYTDEMMARAPHFEPAQAGIAPEHTQDLVTADTLVRVLFFHIPGPHGERVRWARMCSQLAAYHVACSQAAAQQAACSQAAAQQAGRSHSAACAV